MPATYYHSCAAFDPIRFIPAQRDSYLHFLSFFDGASMPTLTLPACDVFLSDLELLTGYISTMTSTIDYLMTFRKCSSLDSVERVYDKLNYSLTDPNELSNMYRAADHRRAELVSGKLFDLGKVPKSLWAQVF